MSHKLHLLKLLLTDTKRFSQQDSFLLSFPVTRSPGTCNKQQLTTNKTKPERVSRQVCHWSCGLFTATPSGCFVFCHRGSSWHLDSHTSPLTNGQRHRDNLSLGKRQTLPPAQQQKIHLQAGHLGSPCSNLYNLCYKAKKNIDQSSVCTKWSTVSIICF